MSKNIDYDDIADSIFEETNKVRKKSSKLHSKTKRMFKQFP